MKKPQPRKRKKTKPRSRETYSPMVVGDWFSDISGKVWQVTYVDDHVLVATQVKLKP
jgi:hypothetical protein